ncbi:MAG TPA: hypothetical protein VD996_06420 [Chitinophagaceae bacterium]|nr:hypothetical protein [Chitinophagaceae bacterium]
MKTPLGIFAAFSKYAVLFFLLLNAPDATCFNPMEIVPEFVADIYRHTDKLLGVVDRYADQQKDETLQGS